MSGKSTNCGGWLSQRSVNTLRAEQCLAQKYEMPEADHTNKLITSSVAYQQVSSPVNNSMDSSRMFHLLCSQNCTETLHFQACCVLLPLLLCLNKDTDYTGLLLPFHQRNFTWSQLSFFMCLVFP